jgi:predicted nucleic acid-binding protein
VIILDTSFLIDFFRNERLIAAIPDDQKPVVTVISYYEILAGVRRMRSPREEKFFTHFFSDIEILDLTLPAAEIASDIGARMASHGNRVNAFDILIAGIALAYHAGEILTADSDFREIAKYSGIEVRDYDRTG